jgi:hypothetical protein
VLYRVRTIQASLLLVGLAPHSACARSCCLRLPLVVHSDCGPMQIQHRNAHRSITMLGKVIPHVQICGKLPLTM